METDSVGFGPDISLVNDPYVQRGDIIPLHIDVIPAVQFGILKNNQRSMGVAADELAKELTLQANIFNRLNNLI